MEDAKLKELQELKKQRQKELAEKKKLLDDLKKKQQDKLRQNAGKGDKHAATAPMDELLEEILSAPPVFKKDEAAALAAPAKGDKGAGKAGTGAGGAAGKGGVRLGRSPNVAEVHIQPKVVDAYEKATQADIEGDHHPRVREGGEEEGEGEGLDDLKPPTHGGHAPPPKGRERRSSVVSAQKFREAHAKAGDKHVHPHPPPSGEGEEGEGDHAKKEIEKHELPDEDRQKILTSTDFADFFNKTSRLVERALGAQFDILVDYSGVAAEEGNDMEGVEKVKRHETYRDDKWTQGRCVTSVCNSPKFPELFMASYGQRENAAPTDPDGCVLVWSLPMTQRPEYVFTCQSAVLTACFDKFQPHLVIGGTYSGSIVLWDTRAKAGPIHRTPLSSRGHAHPVYSMALVGTQNAHNLISVSTDGRLCVWSLGMLVHPQEFIDFKKGNRDVSVTCMAFEEGETNVLMAGAEDGSIVQAHIHGTKVGVTEAFEGHDGPITGVDYHPIGEAASHGADFSDLLLSTSFDWTIRLWSPKHHSQCLHSFEVSEDYVYDAKWHPHHPAVFASVDGEGNLDVWDLNKDLESPHVRVNSGESAMNHLCWSPDGRRLVSGTSEGIIAVWNVDKELTTPKPEDWARLEEQIMDLKPADAGAGTVGTGVGVGAPVGGKLAIDSKAKDILGEK